MSIDEEKVIRILRFQDERRPLVLRKIVLTDGTELYEADYIRPFIVHENKRIEVVLCTRAFNTINGNLLLEQLTQKERI